MSKHPKPGGGKLHTSPAEDGAGKQKRDVSGDIEVRGEVEVKVPVEVSKKRDAAEETRNARDKKRFIVEITGLIVVIVYAGLTAILAYLEWGQLCESRKITRATQDNFKAGERAWVGIESNPLLMVGEIGTPVKWRVFYKNFGNSPAFYVSWRTRLVRSEGPIQWNQIQRVTDSLTTDESTAYTLFNSQESIDPGIATDPMTADTKANILNDTWHWLLLGKVTYRDEFGENHITTFCRRYVHAYQGFPEMMFPCPIRETAN